MVYLNTPVSELLVLGTDLGRPVQSPSRAPLAPAVVQRYPAMFRNKIPTAS